MKNTWNERYSEYLCDIILYIIVTTYPNNNNILDYIQ